MKRKLAALGLAVSILLTGCGWMDGSYSSVTPHQGQKQTQQSGATVASNYMDLIQALENMIREGSESGVINVADYPEKAVESGMAMAVRYATESYPVGAYAVERIDYELGANGGLPAIAVTVTYRHSRSELQMIRQVKDMTEAEAEVDKALESYAAGVVLLVEQYTATDFSQMVRDYGEAYPEKVMEIPQVTAAIHGVGVSRVAELTFTYQTSRDSLRQMQSQVKPVFDAAALYVSGDGAEKQKFSQLYGFLMERFDYEVETSITPAYSLLRHGVGDSRAFATVYAAMCRLAGLECMTVTGTRAGEPWTWNIVQEGGHYFHVDLLRSSEAGAFREFTDREMTGYVWDYSAYPQCPEIGTLPEETEPTQADTPAPPESQPTEETTAPAEVLPPEQSMADPEPSAPEETEIAQS
ncbi:MAG: transglutaminase-like domain-containing protein [Firmicutes bacterium]|nr:transglutaminase-like domain-containing protein [Bacillota bacterium]